MIKTEKHAPMNWPMDSHELCEKLGLDRNQPLPEDGTGITVIQGYKVYVAPRTDKVRKLHRILVICKGCGTPYPAGRLSQHEAGCKRYQNIYGKGK